MLNKMKNHKINIVNVIVILFTITIVLGCKKNNEDEFLPTKEFSIYIAPGDLAYNVINGNSVVSWTDEIIQNPKAKFEVLLSRPFDQDITIKANIDTSELAFYDDVYKVTSPRFKDNNFKIVEGPIIIKAGEVKSPSIQIELANVSELIANTDYIIPVKISNENNIPVSKNRNTIFIKLKYTPITPFIVGKVNNSNISDISIIKAGNKIIGPSNFSFAASLNIPFSKDIEIEIETDPTLINRFNQENNTSNILFPQNSYTITESKITIPEGNNRNSDANFNIEFKNLNELEVAKTYLIPIKIKNYDSKAEKLDNSVLFIRASVTETNIDPSNQAFSEPYMDRTGWTVTASGSWSINVIGRVLDGNNSTPWDSDGWMPSWVILDIKSQKTIKGFAIVPNYQYRADDILTMEVLSSNDGVNWNSQGTYNGTPTNPFSSVINPDIKTVRFVNPVNARYFKFNITKSTDGDYTGMAELNAIQ